MKLKVALLFSLLTLIACAEMETSSPKASYEGGSADAKNSSDDGAIRSDDSQKLSEKISDATRIYRDLLAIEDREVPENLVAKASCVAILPDVVQGAFIVGGKYGTGIVNCKNDGVWSAPAFIQLSAASIGFQIGADVSNLVLFFVGDSAVESLYTSNITLGGDVTVAAGPVGRTAQGKTDFVDTGIYAYATTKGLFAGISLEGAVITPDKMANESYYGRPLKNRHILEANSDVVAPDDAQQLQKILAKEISSATAVENATEEKPTGQGSNPFFDKPAS